MKRLILSALLTAYCLTVQSATIAAEQADPFQAEADRQKQAEATAAANARVPKGKSSWKPPRHRTPKQPQRCSLGSGSVNGTSKTQKACAIPLPGNSFASAGHLTAANGT